MKKRLLLTALLAACSSAGTPSVDSTSAGRTTITGGDRGGAQVNVAVDKVALGGALPFAVTRAWAALPAAYKALGLAVEYTDDRTRTLGNTRLTARTMLGDTRMSTYLRCGQGITGPIADTHRIRMNIRTQLKGSAADSTMVSTVIEASASSVEGASGSTNECTSTGALEQAIVRRLTWETINR